MIHYKQETKINDFNQLSMNERIERIQYRSEVTFVVVHVLNSFDGEAYFYTEI